MVNFRAIKTGHNSKFSNEQNIVVENIKSALKTSNPDFSGSTPEDYFKSKHNLDFLILPATFDRNSVELIGTSFSQNEKGDYTYKMTDNFYIGKYSRQSTEIGNNNILQDIYNAKTKNSEAANKLWWYLALAVFLYGSFFVIGRAKKPLSAPKTVIENADTLLKKSDTIMPDTAKFWEYAGK